MSYVYDATLARVIDGDTVVLNLTKTYTSTQVNDFGFYVKETVTTTVTKEATVHFRLYGINAPEIHGPTQARGEMSKAEVFRLLALGKISVESLGPDKYGDRWLGKITVIKPDGTAVLVNDELVKGGFAKPYFGEGVKPI